MTSEGLHFVKKAIELQKDNPDYWLVLADICRKSGAIEDAKEAYEKVISIAPENIDLWLDYSDMYFAQNLPEEAIDIISEGIKHNPDKAELYYRAAACFLSIGYDTDTYENLNQALDLDFEKHSQLFEYFPIAKSTIFVLDLIDAYKPA